VGWTLTAFLALCLNIMKPIYLYHGSKVLVDELVPSHWYGFGGDVDCFAGVYAVERKELAIPFCFELIHVMNGSLFSVETNNDNENETPEVILKNCEIDWEHKGYLYKMKSNTFESVDSLQWAL